MTQTTKTKAKKATKPAKRKMNVGGAVAVKPKKKRNYAQENARYKSRPDQIAKRTSRNKARRAAIKSGVVRKGDGKDVDHKNGNPMDNRPSNLRAIPASANRSFPRNKRAGKLGLSRGGSARKAQMLAKQYKAKGGGYKS